MPSIVASIGKTTNAPYAAVVMQVRFPSRIRPIVTFFLHFIGSFSWCFGPLGGSLLGAVASHMPAVQGSQL